MENLTDLSYIDQLILEQLDYDIKDLVSIDKLSFKERARYSSFGEAFQLFIYQKGFGFSTQDDVHYRKVEFYKDETESILLYVMMESNEGVVERFTVLDKYEF
tara:strand:- start:115 stop:423 length:309 start_codon:yes stop_codon:yes gene_type:complete